MCTARELESKEVVNLCNGRCLGRICDFEVELCDGEIKAIFVPDGHSLFGKGENIRIPWDKIKKIGEDAILVEIPDRECKTADGCDSKGSPKKKGRLFF